MYLLMKRGLYWRPDSAGYTGLKREAGRYHFKYAADRAYGNPEVSVIYEAHAAEFSPGCPECVKFEERAYQRGYKAGLAAAEAALAGMQEGDD